MDPGKLGSALSSRTRCLLPVHLYGHPAPMDRIVEFAERHDLYVVEDCAQAHGASAGGHHVGGFGDVGCFSFYPTKNLGAFGDAGAVITNDASLADRLRQLRNGGQTDRYHHTAFGVNSRLDEIQAAVLRARLPWLSKWTARRRELAGRYRHGLMDCAVTVPPEVEPGHVYHLFPVLTDDRDGFQQHLSDHGVGTLVHYPIPIPRQAAFAGLQASTCPEADRVAGRVCSLPLHPQLADADPNRVVAAVQSWSPPQPTTED